MSDFSFPNIIKFAKPSYSDGKLVLGEHKIDLGLSTTLFLAIAYFLLFFSISIFRYNTLQYHDYDFSLYANAMWSLTSGKAFIPVINRPLLANHFTVIAFLVAPIFFLLRSPITLLCLKMLSISLVTIPIYLLARRKFIWYVAVGFVLIYLLYPSLLYITLYEFHFEDFSILFLALAFYFLIVGKKPWFFLSGILAMFCKENVPAVVAALGMYGLLFRPRRRLMGLAMFILGASYFLLVTLYLHPAVTPGSGGSSDYVAHYAEYGKDFSSVYVYMLTHPMAIIKDLFSTQLKVQFFKDSFSPLLYLPLLRPDLLLITAPTILKNLLSKVPTTHTIYWQYTATIIPFFVFSLIYGLKKLARYPLIKKNLIYLIAVIVLFEVFQNYKLYQKSHYFVRFHTQVTSEDRAKIDALELIPPGTSVIATFDFLPKLSQRKELFTFYLLWRGALKDFPKVEYALIDFNDYFIEKDMNFLSQKIAAILAHYSINPHWGVSYVEGDTVLLKKNHVSEEKILTLLDAKAFPSGEKEYLTLDESLELVNFEIKSTEKENTIHLVFYWRLVNPSSSLYKIFFFASDGKTDRMFHDHSVGYRFFTPKLGKDEILKEDYWLPLPDKLGPHNYTFSMGFVNLTERRLARVKTTDKVPVDRQGKFVLGNYDNRK